MGKILTFDDFMSMVKQENESRPLTKRWDLFEKMRVATIRYGSYMRNLGRYEGWNHGVSDMVFKAGYSTSNCPSNPYKKEDSHA